MLPGAGWAAISCNGAYTAQGLPESDVLHTPAKSFGNCAIFRNGGHLRPAACQLGELSDATRAADMIVAKWTKLRTPPWTKQAGGTK